MDGCTMKQYVPLETAKEIAFTHFFWPFKREFPGTKIAIAGSILRKRATVTKDIDVVICDNSESVIEWARKKIDSKEPGSVHIKGTLFGLGVDVWFTTEDEWAPMLLFATGPSEFNIFMRKMAKDFGMILNSKGLFLRTKEGEQGARIDNNTEGNIIWLTLKRKWIPPEMRDEVGFKKRERVATHCIECNVPFKKDDRLVLNNEREWIHQDHMEKREQ